MLGRAKPDTQRSSWTFQSTVSESKPFWHVFMSFAGLLLLGAARPELLNSHSHSHVDKSGFQKIANSSIQVASQGDQVSINGQSFPVAWSRWQIGTPDNYHIGISDTGLMQILGVNLLNTEDANQQPIAWFSRKTTTTNTLSALLIGQFRYLDITKLALDSGWQIAIDGQTLDITTVPAQVQSISVGQQPWGNRIVLNLDRPTPWQLRQQAGDWVVTLDASTNQSILQRFNSSISVESVSNRTTLRLKTPKGLSPNISTLTHPNRLIIDSRPDAMVERDILWAPGLRWRQEYISLGGSSRFPIVWLEINLHQTGLTLRPIWNSPNVTSLQGTASLLKTALIWQALAAINGGFFDRNQQLPLGAIRRDGQWFSGPILNRGAIAWNDKGQVKMGRLSLQETLMTSSGKRLPVVTLNSGYVQAGVARYTPAWGATYTPLIDDEILVIVRDNQVISQKSVGAASQVSLPIPSDGYLLVLRANSSAASLLAVGTSLQIESITIPDEFSSYPYILGAGPLLVQNRQIVLEAKAEKFSNAFIQETAIRSAVGTTDSGNLIIVTTHNPVGGRGLTLATMAHLMQKLGAIDALNLDGGSSTTLYLGGQIINRSPSTVSRVHNGLGIFWQPSSLGRKF